MNTRQYLDRINYTGDLNLTKETLWALQRAHLMNVPFENLDIHNKVRIDLANSYDKIVTRKRGGFCYELNGLFYELLNEIGFTAKMVSARVFNIEEGYGPEFDHLAIIVKIHNEDWLVDVGFGEFALHPLKIELNKKMEDPRGVFIIENYDKEYKVVKKQDASGTFIPEYIFSEKERRLDEFSEMCAYHQTSAQSHFTQNRICSLPTGAGRITLKGNMLKITAKDGASEKELRDEAEVKQVLWDYFGIRI